MDKSHYDRPSLFINQYIACVVVKLSLASATNKGSSDRTSLALKDASPGTLETTAPYSFYRRAYLRSELPAHNGDKTSFSLEPFL